jgi:hypothetical protein
MDKATKCASTLTKIHFGIVGLFIVVEVISSILPIPMTVTDAIGTPFFDYILLFSCIPPIVIIVLSIIGLIRDKDKASNALCLTFSLLYDFAALGFSLILYAGSHF